MILNRLSQEYPQCPDPVRLKAALLFCGVQYHECLIQSLYDRFYAHGDLTNEVRYDKALADGFQNPYQQ